MQVEMRIMRRRQSRCDAMHMSDANEDGEVEETSTYRVRSRKKRQKSKKSSQQSSRRVCSLCTKQRVDGEMRAVTSVALLVRTRTIFAVWSEEDVSDMVERENCERWRPTAIDDFSSRVLAVDEAADSARVGNPLSFARIIRTTLSATFLALGLFRAALTTFEAPDYKSRAKIVFAGPTRSSRNRASAPAMNFVEFFAAREVAEGLSSFVLDVRLQ